MNATSALMLPPQWFLIIKWIVAIRYKLITRCVHFIKSVSATGKSFLHLSRRVSGCNINNMPNNSRPNNGNKSVTTQRKDKVKLVATAKQLQVRNDNWHELAETPSPSCPFSIPLLPLYSLKYSAHLNPWRDEKGAIPLVAATQQPPNRQLQCFAQFILLLFGKQLS